MSSSIRFAVFALVLVWATGASAEDRCEGTFCDFYYGNSPAPAPAPAPATPMMVPRGNLFGGLFSGGDSQPQAAAPGTQAATQPAQGRAPMVSVGGGGVLGLARGAPAERCGGTLCDLFYGGPSPGEQREAQGVQAPPPSSSASTASGAVLLPGAETDGTPRPTKRRRGAVEYATEQQGKPQCVAPPGDPWRCYRK